MSADLFPVVREVAARHIPERDGRRVLRDGDRVPLDEWCAIEARVGERVAVTADGRLCVGPVRS